MTEKQIQYFFAVYKHSNIAKASEELLVSRPVISRAIADLEKETNIKLFERISSGVIPTQQGRKFHEMLESISKVYKITIEKLQDPYFSKESRGLRIGIQNVSCGWFYPLVYRPFHEKHPDAIVKIEGVKAEEAYELVIDGVLDMAIAPILSENTDLLGKLYLYSSQIVLCSPINGTKAGASGVTLGEVSNLPLAILETLTPPFYEHKNTVLSTKDPEMVRIAITNGYAYAILPLELCANWDDVAIIPFQPPKTLQIHLFWNNSIPRSHVVDDFVNVVKGIDLEPLRSSCIGKYLESRQASLLHNIAHGVKKR